MVQSNHQKQCMYIRAKYGIHCKKKCQNPKAMSTQKTQLRNRLPHPPIALWLIGQPPQTLAMESRSDVAGIRLGRGPCEPILARALEDNHAEIRTTPRTRVHFLF
jgi:hypothetical protein